MRSYFIGFQKLNSNATEVRTLVQAMAKKLKENKIVLDSKGIGCALYGAFLLLLFLLFFSHYL